MLRRLRAAAWTAAVGLLLAATLGTATASCGSEVSAPGDNGSSGAGSGTAGADGETPTCSTDYPCTRFPEGDSFCMQYGAPPLGYGCGTMRFISAECVYSYGPNSQFYHCENCGNWCDPPEPWQGPTYAELDAGPPLDSPPPPRGQRQPDDDYACLAQGKPASAVYCPGLDLSTKPEGCFGNPYGNGSCYGPPELGYFCCPAQ